MTARERLQGDERRREWAPRGRGGGGNLVGEGWRGGGKKALEEGGNRKEKRGAERTGYDWCLPISAASRI